MKEAKIQTNKQTNKDTPQEASIVAASFLIVNKTSLDLRILCAGKLKHIQ